MPRSPSIIRCAWVLAGTVLLASCSSIPLEQREAARRSQFEAYAGKPVPEFTWITRGRGWMPISHYQVVLWAGINQPYLITVASPCTDLMFARGIGVSTTANTVYARFDSIKAAGWNCVIHTIQPVDYRRMQHDMRAANASESK
jgi:Family of unknown function (DUF6491)